MNSNSYCETNNKLICKICFSNFVTHTMIHENHCCAVMCNECLNKVNDECPFFKCKSNNERKRIII